MILFSAKISGKYQDALKQQFPHQQFVFSNPDDITNYISDAEVFVTYGDDVNTNLITEAINLKWVASLSAGVEGSPFQLMKEKGILFTNSRGIHKIQMAEYAISMLLQVYRQSNVVRTNEINHKWDKSVRMQEITGKTMLIAGTGAIGEEVARLAKAFQMKTIGISRSGRKVENFDENYPIDDLDQLLPNVDFVVSVLPSTDDTKGIFASKQFKALPNHAVFLNMGRGDAVIDEDLLQAIKDNEIAHAVLDVFNEEPLPTGHAFWEEEKITITPHISAMSPNYVPRALEIFTTNLQTYVTGQGEYINVIDPNRGY
ncbi:D-2-hydroxyacid dehydrogenase [Oceanobacillus chungangensis]|uniref:D-2-hydroxyacid dehydrogenase n=1 Tax=Oceanobacillus chungangensis TaxID=1229152 RepID=A0A3D8PMW0_9BACI|nr:D-2-hydroxyacid dehydrogenase [Oceanobacillus chungangensis]RDW17430.1 D-2-hydroxyacid dehydrogenase [Oceanobacillus chungangensis]